MGYHEYELRESKYVELINKFQGKIHCIDNAENWWHENWRSSWPQSE